MIIKKIVTLLAVVCVALTATACSQPTNQDYYESAQLYLGSGDCELAADLFRQLGEYRDSAPYTLYCEALQAIADDDLALARANLTAIAPFKSSEMYLTWLDAAEAETKGDLEDALAIFETLGTFADSDVRADALRTAIPETAMKEARALMAAGDYAAARDIFLSLDGYGASKTLANNCEVAIGKEAYSKADALCKSGDHLAAMEAFLVLGEMLDAPDRAQKCRENMLAALEERYAAVTMETAADLAEAYAALDDDAARSRAAELADRFGVNLTLLSQAEQHPYVLLEDTTRWQVMSAEGSVLKLVFDGMVALAAEQVATSTDLPMTADLTPDGLTLKIDLAEYTFAAGSGTKEDPYR